MDQSALLPMKGDKGNASARYPLGRVGQTFVSRNIVVTIIGKHIVLAGEVGHEVVVGIHVAVGSGGQRGRRGRLGAG